MHTYIISNQVVFEIIEGFLNSAMFYFGACLPDSVFLGDAASGEGVCSQRRQWKPSCTGNHPRYDRRLPEVHQPSKCVSVKYMGASCSNLRERSGPISLSLTAHDFIMWVCVCVAISFCALF